MKIIKELLVLCENAVVDNTNKITLVNIFNNITAAKVPILYPKSFCVFSFILEDLAKETKTLDLELQIKTPTNKDLLPNPIKVSITIDKRKHIQRYGTVIQLNGILFPEYGDYRLVVNLNGKFTFDSILEILQQKINYGPN